MFRCFQPAGLFCTLLALLSISPAQARSMPPARRPPAPPPAPRPLDPALRDAMRSAPAAAQYPNNNYVCLLDIGQVTVRPDGTVVAEYREAYKLYNDRARDMAEVSLPYNASYQRVEVLRARTVKKNGQIMEVRPADIRTQSSYSDYALYADNKTVGFSMPGVEDDCVIDYTWRLTTRPILPGHFFDKWTFSDASPKLVSRLTLRLPAGKPFRYQTHNDGALKPVVQASRDGRTKTYTWEMKNLPPLQEEPSMPEGDEVRVWLEYSSISGWADLARWYEGLVRPQAAADAPIRATVSKLIAGKATEEEKARAIYDWVANRVRYVGLEFGISAYRPHAAGQVHEKLYGDCKDKATLLITMLGLAGIRAYPALLNTGAKRPLRDDLPALDAFDHCIALADMNGKPVWLDATAETCAYGDIPGGDRGADAFVIREGAGRFETIPAYQPEENGTDLQTQVTVRADGSAEMRLDIRLRGATAQRLRAQLRNLTPEQRQMAASALAQTFASGATVKTFTFPEDDKAAPCILRMTVQAPRCARRVGRLLLLPVAAANGAGSERGNPFIKETRVWPIVLSEAVMTRAETTYSLPEGYTLDETPEDCHIVGPLNTYDRKIVRSPDGMTLTIHETNTSRPGRIPASDYARIRTYYDDAVRVTEDLIVLRRARG